MRRWGVIIVLLISIVNADWNIQQHLGTQTPYWSPGPILPSPSPSPSCSLLHLDLVSRHGARNPTNGDLQSMNVLADTVKNYSAYINDNYPWIKNWSNPFIPDQQGFLSFSGQEELFHMGERFNSTYYPLFSSQYYPDIYVMQSTQVPRAGVSASSFAQGYLQGKGEIGSMNFQPPYIFSDTPADDVLRFFDNCKQYVQATNNGTISDSEYQKYIKVQYPPIAAKIATALGVTGYWQISNDEVDTMITACAFEVAVYNKTDGWCSLFSQEDILVYEYASDLDNYWIKSYGSGLGYKIGAVVLQNIVSTMDSIVNKSNTFQKAYLRFAHAETIMPLSAVLGFYKDNYTLTADLSQEQIASRLWTTSVVSPFGSNIGFFLYSCDGNDYRVRITLNEVETQIPGCDEIYCPYNQFKSLYAEALSFNFTSSCALPTNTTNNNEKRFSMAVFTGSVFGAFFIGAALVVVLFVMYIRKNSVQYSAIINQT